MTEIGENQTPAEISFEYKGHFSEAVDICNKAIEVQPNVKFSIESATDRPTLHKLCLTLKRDSFRKFIDLLKNNNS